MVFCGACDFGIRYLFPEGGILNLGNRDVAAQWSVKNDKDYFFFWKKIHTDCINVVMQTEKSDYANKHNPLEIFNQHHFFVDFFGQLVHENATK